MSRVASNVIVLLQMVTQDELLDDQEYNDIKEDVHDECSKYGQVEAVVIPRPGYDPTGVGKVYVKFDSVESATAARDALAGRKFDSRTVVAQFYSDDKFAAGQFT